MTTIATAGANHREGAFARIAALFADWNEARVTRRELNRLSDRELEDIGMNRADIDTIVARR